jgi:two-component system sensor histidine kinase AgrC
VARQAGIKLKREFDLLDAKLPIPEEDLCVLLGNALDNAIEASQKVAAESKTVDLLIRQDKGVFQIRVQNPYAVSPSFVNGSFHSSKGDPQNHGFGIASMKQIVDKHSGNLLIRGC